MHRILGGLLGACIGAVLGIRFGWLRGVEAAEIQQQSPARKAREPLQFDAELNETGGITLTCWGGSELETRVAAMTFEAAETGEA